MASTPLTDRRRVAVIVNPVSGRARARCRAKKLLDCLAGQSMAVTLHETSGPGDGRTFAARVAREMDALVIVGGDGTLNEVMNGVLDSGARTPMGIVTTGTANVVARELGLSGTLEEIVQIIRHGPERCLDAGLMRNAAGETRGFVMCAGAGPDAAVVERVHRARTAAGITFGSYALPVVKTLLFYKFPPMRVSLDGVPQDRTSVFTLVANMRRYGGDFHACANALPDDGWLDVCCVQRRGLWPLLRLGWAAFRKRACSSPDVVFRRARAIELSADESVPVQADGDCAGQLPMRFEVHPAAVRFCVAPRTGGETPAPR